MGIMRKSLSTFTLGAVDFRSDKERVARSTRKAHHEARRQTRELRDQTKLLKTQGESSQASHGSDEITWKWWK